MRTMIHESSSWDCWVMYRGSGISGLESWIEGVGSPFRGPGRLIPCSVRPRTIFQDSIDAKHRIKYDLTLIQVQCYFDRTITELGRYFVHTKNKKREIELEKTLKSLERLESLLVVKRSRVAHLQECLNCYRGTDKVEAKKNTTSIKVQPKYEHTQEEVDPEFEEYIPKQKSVVFKPTSLYTWNRHSSSTMREPRHVRNL